MKTISRYIMTLVALLALTTQAWATDVYVVGNGDGNWLNNAAWDPGAAGNKMTEQNGVYSITFTNVDANSDLEFKFAINGSWNENFGCTSWDANELNKTLSNIEALGNNIMFVLTEAADVTISFNLSELTYMISTNGMKVGDDTPVEWDAATKTGTFAMPASNVVLTPIYAAATIYDANQTEKGSYETFKEAFLAAQDGDIIKLDWNVTVTSKTDLMTGKRATADPVKFTIDFNGYILDGSSAGSTFINTEHEGDEITFIDSSVDQTGGLKGMVSGVDNSFVFSSGRYNFNDGTAADIESLWTTLLVPNGWAMADGKEFIDIENAPDANGFYLYIGYKDIELTIGTGRFETFYSDQNVVLADGTPAGIELYTIKSINADLSTATLSDPLTDIIVAGTPILVYNGTADEQTVTIKVTTDQPFNALMWAGAFQGTAVDKEFTEDDMEDYDYYALSGGKAFVKVRGAGILGAHQCYLEIPKQQSAGSKARGITIVFDDDEATRINEVIEVNGVNDDTWYDLSGRRVTKPTKGVFIKNGKKVVK